MYVFQKPCLEVIAKLTDAEADSRSSDSMIFIGALRYHYELSRAFASYIAAYKSRSLGDKADQVCDDDSEP